MKALQAETGTEVVTSEVLGVPPDAREALVFATLGARFVAGEALTRVRVTGAQEGVVLGCWTPAPGPGSLDAGAQGASLEPF